MIVMLDRQTEVRRVLRRIQSEASVSSLSASLSSVTFMYVALLIACNLHEQRCTDDVAWTVVEAWALCPALYSTSVYEWSFDFDQVGS
jgi:hypothetical protein